jgi:transposase
LTISLIDWETQKAICPAGKESVYWNEEAAAGWYPRSNVLIRFKARDCLNCLSRSKCIRSKTGQARRLRLPARPLYEALAATRKLLSTEVGRHEYQHRAGIEGTISQAVRRGSLRRSRYSGQQKTELQEIALATGINLLRTINFLEGKAIAKTRVSRFRKLAH